MKITNAVVLVELDDSDEFRQLFIRKDLVPILITCIEAGMFQKGKEVLISDKIIDTIEVQKVKDDDEQRNRKKKTD